MKNSLKWTAAFLAACMMLSVGVMAEDTADETSEPTAEAEVAEATEEATEETAVDESAEAPAYTPAYVAIDGKEKVTVTSSVCDLLPDVSLDCIFDSVDESNMTVAFDDETPVKAINVYASVAGPVVADTFAFRMDMEPGTVVGINIYATNDNTLTDWYQLKVNNPAEDKDGFKVFTVKDYVRKFSYFRFEFVILTGNSFSVSEAALYCDEGEATVVKYTSDGEVEEGTTPDSVTYSTKKEENTVINPFVPGLAVKAVKDKWNNK